MNVAISAMARAPKPSTCARAPAVAARLDDRVDRGHQRGRHEHRADQSTLGPARRRLVARDQGAAERDRDRADREVDEEDPVPAQRLGQRAAGEQSERAAGDGDEHVRAHRAGAVAGLGELGGDDREDHRGRKRGADALEEAGARSGHPRWGEPAQQRGDGEDDDAGRKTRLRPKRSPSRPASSSKLPKVTRNALITQVRFPWVKWRSRWIEGSATLTMVVSRTIISCARQTTTSANQRRRSPAVPRRREKDGA